MVFDERAKRHLVSDAAYAASEPRAAKGVPAASKPYATKPVHSLRREWSEPPQAGNGTESAAENFPKNC